MAVRIGFDIGGTFTDVYAVDEETGEIMQEKVPTTPSNFADGATSGIQAICDSNDIDGEEITHLSHGTTVATNTMLEQTGATTGLITTEGFRDVLAIGRENRTDLYNFSPEKNPTFVDRRFRIGVPERVGPEGEVVEELDETAVEDAVEKLVENGVDSIAVSLLNSYRNDEHEKAIHEIVQRKTDVPVSLSMEVMPEIKEYERTLSTVINAYVSPDVVDYISQLREGLNDLDIDNELHLMQANGGVLTPENIDGRSLRLINSGPAGGVIGAKRSAQESNIENIITLDMGGTSADACVVKDGEIETTTEGEIANLPLLFPQVDIRTVGAGGGSIAWLDDAGVLNVGPKSSGAEPGPACYGKGGTDPTVTDAALLLGYLNPDYFLGGDMGLDVEAARSVIEPLADDLNKDPVELSSGILDIATTNIKQAIRLVTVEKGYDPREFALTCFGGAGPLFASLLAKKLDIERVLIPTTPGVLSATGLSTADERFDFSKSVPMTVESSNLDVIADTYEELYDRAASSIALEVDEAKLEHSADLRYEGQTSQVNVRLPASIVEEGDTEEIRERFHDQYQSMYGHANRDKPVEGVTWRLEVVDEAASVKQAPPLQGGSLENATKTHRDIYIDGEFVSCPVYDRYRIPTGTTFEGPAIIEETESTTVVESDSTIHIGDTGNMLVTLDQ